ncbi:MAG: TPM domain-containing protein, partial [Bacteroidales bacterium]|nr:TPM domain-containing protein [Bacteroidales bacterium]
MRTKQWISFLGLFVAFCLMVANIACGGANREKEGDEDTLPVFVNDYAKVFSASQWDETENRLENLDLSTGNQVAVVTITELDAYDNALEYATAWG